MQKKYSPGFPFFTDRSRQLFIGIIVVFLNGSLCSVHAQTTLTLNESVRLAQQQSPYYHRAKNTFERSYWQFQNFKANFRPQIRLSATAPTFYRMINPITQPDGSIEFRRISQANNSLGVNVVQNIGLTGGTLQAGTRLQRTDNFSGNESSYFLSTPFTIAYQQSSLLYNELRWKKQLEPLLYQTAEKAYAEEMEAAALEAATLFLNALVAQADEQIAKTNLANTDTLYLISKERYALGTIARNDILQLELNVLKAKNTWNDARITKEVTSRNLKRILGIPIHDSLSFAIPLVEKRVFADYNKALDEARENRQTVLEFRTRRIQAEQQIAQAKGQNSLQFSLSANIGTQQTAPQFADAYRNLQNQQYIGVTFDLPIQDWGYRKSQIRLSQANRELVEVNVQQDELKFEQEIYLQVLQFNQQYNQLMVTQKADTVARERFNSTKERYLLGKVSVTDLNLALEENVNAGKAYIDALRTYWIAHHTLRRLTLYDFMKNETLYYKTNNK